VYTHEVVNACSATADDATATSSQVLAPALPFSDMALVVLQWQATAGAGLLAGVCPPYWPQALVPLGRDLAGPNGHFDVLLLASIAY
jgi:hypothetical protein